MTDHTALISSLEKATEGSRELDALVWEALGAAVKRDHARTKYAIRGDLPWGWTDRWQHMLYVTTSVDDVAYLIGRTCPGRFTALLAQSAHATSGRALALALCIALLQALQHQGGGNG